MLRLSEVDSEGEIVCVAGGTAGCEATLLRGLYERNGARQARSSLNDYGRCSYNTSLKTFFLISMKFFVSTIFTIGLVAAGWHYAPQYVKTALLGAVGIAARGNGEEIKHFIADVALPKDPAERRAVLTSALEKNIEELKRRIGNTQPPEGGLVLIAAEGTDAAGAPAPAAALPEAKIHAASSQELIAASEGMIKELVNANKDVSLGGKITERILDAVMSRSGSAAQCPAK